MVSLLIFGASFMTILFFLLGVLCKSLAAMFNAAVDAIVKVIMLLFMGGLIALGLYLVYGIAYSFSLQGFGGVVEMIIMLVIIIAIIGGLLSSFGAAIISIAVAIIEIVINVISLILGAGAILCEEAFTFFLGKLVSQIEKC